MATPPIELADLSRALSSLSQGKVRFMCVELGVPPATLSNIDASHPRDALRCITEYLEALLAYDVSLSWERIVDVLNSSRLRQHPLAANIRRAYCMGGQASCLDSPFPRRYLSPSSSDSGEGDHSRTSGAEAATSSYSLRQQEKKGRGSGHDTPSPLPQSPLPMTQKPFDGRELVKKVTHFKKKFRSVVIRTNVHLSQKMSQEDFDCFKIDLITLPMGRTQNFLQREVEKIQEAKSVQEVFKILDPYWNHVDYDLLEHIVKEYCDETIKTLMEGYKRELHEFEKATPVKNFTSTAVDLYPLPPDYMILSLTLRLDAEECSLYHAREVKNSITERANLEPYVLLLNSLHASVVVLTIAFPIALFKPVKRALDSEFLKKLVVVPGSIVSQPLQPSSPPTHRQQVRRANHQ